MSDRITLVKGKLRQNISAFEYSFRKDDMNGWEVEREAPKVPDEVKAAVEKKGTQQDLNEKIKAALDKVDIEAGMKRIQEAAKQTKPRKK